MITIFHITIYLLVAFVLAFGARVYLVRKALSGTLEAHYYHQQQEYNDGKFVNRTSDTHDFIQVGLPVFWPVAIPGWIVGYIVYKTAITVWSATINAADHVAKLTDKIASLEIKDE